MPLKSRITRAMATVGTGLPNESTEGMFLYDNVDILSLDTQETAIDPLRASFTKTPSTIGRQLLQFSGKVFADQHESGASIRYDPLLRCCGLVSNEPAVGTSIDYEPRSTGFEESSIYVDLNGIEYRLDPSRGTFTMTGTAGSPVEISFDIQGVIPAGGILNSTSFTGSFDPGPSVIETFKGATASIAMTSPTRNISCLNNLILKSFTFNRGAELGERTSACAANGLAGLDFANFNPTLEITAEARDLSLGATGEFGHIYDDLAAAAVHDVTVQWGTNASGIWKLSCPQAQPTNISTPDGDAGNRNFVISYRLTHVTDDTEFKLSVNNTGF